MYVSEMSGIRAHNCMSTVNGQNILPLQSKKGWAFRKSSRSRDQQDPHVVFDLRICADELELATSTLPRGTVFTRLITLPEASPMMSSLFHLHPFRNFHTFSFGPFGNFHTYVYILNVR